MAFARNVRLSRPGIRRNAFDTTALRAAPTPPARTGRTYQWYTAGAVFVSMMLDWNGTLGART